MVRDRSGAYDVEGFISRKANVEEKELSNCHRSKGKKKREELQIAESIEALFMPDLSEKTRHREKKQHLPPLHSPFTVPLHGLQTDKQIPAENRHSSPKNTTESRKPRSRHRGAPRASGSTEKGDVFMRRLEYTG